MEDMSAMISNLLSSPEGMAKIQSMASAFLGQSQGADSGSSGRTDQAAPQIDPAMISSLLSGLQGGNSGAASGAQSGQSAPQIDPAMISSLLSGLQGGNSGAASGAQSGQSAPQIDPAMISSLLAGLQGGGQSAQSPTNTPGELPVNPQMLATIAKAMSTMNKSDKNVELLYSLKKHLGEDRSKRVDDAARIMQLIKMLPLLKESGLFGDMLGNFIK